MSDPFTGEIRMFGGNFAPRAWAYCDGQLLAISQNDALFSLLGTIYGGDGRTTFGLPDLRGRVPIHMDQGPGLTKRPIGSKFGTERETLTVPNMPSHGHTVHVTGNAGTTHEPAGKVSALAPVEAYHSTPDANGQFAAAAIGSSGGGQAHGNLMPFLNVHFIICLFGIYPSRN